MGSASEMKPGWQFFLPVKSLRFRKSWKQFFLVKMWYMILIFVLSSIFSLCTPLSFCLPDLSLDIATYPFTDLPFTVRLFHSFFYCQGRATSQGSGWPCACITEAWGLVLWQGSLFMRATRNRDRIEWTCPGECMTRHCLQNLRCTIHGSPNFITAH